jgi:hypothetical protein
MFGEGLIVRPDPGIAMTQCRGLPVVLSCSSSILVNVGGHAIPLLSKSRRLEQE